MSDTELIYHIASAVEIERAARSGKYAPSSLIAQGFIHCCFRQQLSGIADRWFHDKQDLLLLEIDPTRVHCRVVAENLKGGDELFPHVYGELPMLAVLAIRELRCTPDGRFNMPCIVKDEHAMSDLDHYLAKHYVNTTQFASLCGIEVDELRDLIGRELVPGPSYVVRAGELQSYVFGVMSAPGSTPGEYFHPAMATWVVRARHDLATHGVDRARERVRAMFDREFTAAFRELNETVFRLDDAFDEDGQPLGPGLRRRLDSAWEHFVHGTFGLCVANPDSALNIARKEVLQEQLTAMTSNGAKQAFASHELPALTRLIDAYEAESMPFSPIEYPRSSRKRLVDDLRARLRA
jgi:uncharacterized protein (DUF952 family)